MSELVRMTISPQGAKKGEETKRDDGWGTDTKKIDPEQGRRLEPLSSS